jgi:hypothetical protein
MTNFLIFLLGLTIFIVTCFLVKVAAIVAWLWSCDDLDPEEVNVDEVK